jgi:hypothetical protein
VVLSNCPIYTHKFNLSEASFLLSPGSLSPNSCFEDTYTTVDVEQIPATKPENGNYIHQYSPLTPPSSPKMSTMDIVEKARKYVNKVSSIKW